MRTFFQDQEIQDLLRGIFAHYCPYVVESYWQDVVDFFLNDENTFSDLVDFLAEELLVRDEDVLKITHEVFVALEQFQGYIPDFFRIKTPDEFEREEEEVEAALQRNQGEGGVGGGVLETSDGQRGGEGFPAVPSVGRSGTAARAHFYFSPDDEEEIRKIQRLALSGRVAEKEAMDKVYDRVAEEIMKKIKMEL